MHLDTSISMYIDRVGVFFIVNSFGGLGLKEVIIGGQKPTSSMYLL